MKLIKLNEQHYIVVDDSEIKDVRPYKGRWHYEKGVTINQFPTYLTDLSECKLITHSFGQHLEGVINKPLSEVEEAIYGYSMEKAAYNFCDNVVRPKDETRSLFFAFCTGFSTHQELVKDKLFTIEDLRRAFDAGNEGSGGSLRNRVRKYNGFDEYITNELGYVWDEDKGYVEPKQTEWFITFDKQGKLKLL